MDKLSKLSVIIFVLLGLSGLCIASQALAEDITIDDFSGPNFSLPVSPPPPAAPVYSFVAGNSFSRTDSELSDVIGGTRTIDYLQLSGCCGNSVDMASDHFIFSQGGFGAAYFTMLYDANGKGLNADLSAGKSIDVIWKPDHLGFEKSNYMSFTLADTFGNSYESRITWDTYWPNDGPDKVWIPVVFDGKDYGFWSYLAADLTTSFDLNEFALHEVSLAHVNSILFAYESDYANDLSIESFKVKPVPEPISATQFLLGFGAMGLRAYRRKKS